MNMQSTANGVAPVAHQPDPADPEQVPDDLAVARKVLGLEADGIEALAGSLDGRFSQALDILSDVSGRVVVTGMGKSGHIGRKIAATFASTGTPSQYVHPGEASHGDLGMITEADAVVALSNSGETSELSDLLQHCRRFSIPLIAITSRADSTLDTFATVGLILPAVPEADTMGLAPTTSTTMSLALGDALAVALLNRKGFTASDFQILHPGGKLGRQLLRIRDIMHQGEEVPLVPETASMTDVVVEMTRKRFGCVGILDAQGALIGVVTDGDLSRNMSESVLAKPVTALMTRNPVSTRPEALAMEVLGDMNAKKIGAVFVLEGVKPVGILHLHDVLRAGIV
jgi:arabinose-5-phosphate isomerase